jgi:hypothetical protein
LLKANNKNRIGRTSRNEVYLRMRDLVGEVRKRHGGIPTPATARAAWDELWIADAHNSTAIEGNTLTLAQVRAVLIDADAVGTRPLADHLEVAGYAGAARWVISARDERDGITVTDVRRLHELAMGLVWRWQPHPDATHEEAPGGWRRHDIRPFPGGMTPPPWTEVPQLMGDWVRSATLAAGADDELIAERLAASHAAFERIHPFLDGNGRTGRLALNLLLVRAGYPPVVVRSRNRRAYLHALALADGGNPGPLGEMVARGVIDSIQRLIVPAAAGADDAVDLASLADGRIGVAALRAAARRGRLRAHQSERGAWRSTRDDVEAYLADRYRRG